MKQYRLRNRTSGAVSTVDEDQYQTIKGKGWMGRYDLQEVTVATSVQRSFMPPSVIVLNEKKVSAAPAIAPQVVNEKKKPGRPKKQQDAQS